MGLSLTRLPAMIAHAEATLGLGMPSVGHFITGYDDAGEREVLLVGLKLTALASLGQMGSPSPGPCHPP